MPNPFGPRVVYRGHQNGLPVRPLGETLTGIAHGGPKHGLKLTASPRWDGIVAMSREDAKWQRLASNYQHYHRGCYRWQALRDWNTYTWIWVPLDYVPKKPDRRESPPKE